MCCLKKKGSLVTALALSYRSAPRHARKSLHIRCCERVRTPTAARIDPIGRLADPASMEIERIEQARLIFRGLWIYMAERVCLHKKWNLKRFIIRPESHTALPGVITPTLIRKIEWHSSYHSPFSPSGVQFICGAVSPSRLRASTRRDDVSKSECGFYDPRTSFDLGRDPRI